MRNCGVRSSVDAEVWQDRDSEKWPTGFKWKYVYRYKKDAARESAWNFAKSSFFGSCAQVVAQVQATAFWRFVMQSWPILTCKGADTVVTILEIEFPSSFGAPRRNKTLKYCNCMTSFLWTE